MLKRYEQCIRVITAFFAVLLGFGLKKLLDTTSELERDRWPCLILCSLFFLRYLLGSANHLWYEFVRPDPAEIPRTAMMGDFGFLIIFGILGLVICYSTNIVDFLFWNLVLVATATCGALLYTFRGPLMVKGKQGGDWNFWLPINALQALIILIAWLLHNSGVQGRCEWLDWDYALTTLIVVYIVLLGIDFYLQLGVLEKDNP
jgi:hypothetical protein